MRNLTFSRLVTTIGLAALPKIALASDPTPLIRLLMAGVMGIVSTLLVLISYFFPRFGLVAAVAFVATMIPVALSIVGVPGHGSVWIGFYFSWFMGCIAFLLATYRITRGQR